MSDAWIGVTDDIRLGTFNDDIDKKGGRIENQYMIRGWGFLIPWM